MVSRKAIAIFVLAGCFGIAAAPVHAFFQAYNLFNPSDKYGAWFKETTWKGDPRGSGGKGLLVLVGANTAEKYPYPKKTLVMTEKMWLKSTKAVELGTSDWFDAEVVRQRAEVEKHPPAMDFLAWMYEEGRGVEKNPRKAYMWYERAKMAGKVELRGSSTKIFSRMSQEDQYFAELQKVEDIETLRAAGRPVYEGPKQVNLRILEQQRGSAYYKLKRAQSKGKAPY